MAGLVKARTTITMWLPGKATHYRPNNNNVSACGTEHPDYFAYDPRDCNCRRCMKTTKWKIAMNKDATPKERIANLRDTINWKNK